MRCAQFEALSGDVSRNESGNLVKGASLNPLGSYSPRGTMTSQQPRGLPLPSSSPQPSAGASLLVSVSNCCSPVPLLLVVAPCTSLVLNWENASVRGAASLFAYSGCVGSSTGTKGMLKCVSP